MRKFPDYIIYNCIKIKSKEKNNNNKTKIETTLQKTIQFATKNKDRGEFLRSITLLTSSLSNYEVLFLLIFFLFHEQLQI